MKSDQKNMVLVVFGLDCHCGAFCQGAGMSVGIENVGPSFSGFCPVTVIVQGGRRLVG